jgi:predicted AAA+ superfamily ATPase
VIKRRFHLDAVKARLSGSPVVGIVGARQVGKTTLARQIAGAHKGRVSNFDLEDSRDLARMADPMLALEPLRGLVIIDEIQRTPGLFTTLRVLSDRPRRPATFMILGSASPELLRQSSESLAGRISYYELPGFSLREVGSKNATRLWLRGGFPRSYVASNGATSYAWRQDFLRTFVERDLPQLGIGVSPTTIRRFWTMLAHYHGQTWNASEFARSFAVSDTTVRRYLDALTSSLVVRQLPAWHENVAKRQVRAPKVFIRDQGLLHALLGLERMSDLEGHPKVGASWEGFAAAEVLELLASHPGEAYHWATHAGAELDLLVVRGRRRTGFEFKRTSAPRVTRSMRSALNDLKLQRLYVVHAGSESFSLDKKIHAIALTDLPEEITAATGR